MNTDSIDLQTAIDQKVLELGSVKTPEARRNAWNELQALIKSRPAEVVKKMEVERGLTR